MAIRTVVTRGFGNGTFNGTIPLVVTRGYAIAQVVVIDPTFIPELLSGDHTPDLLASDHTPQLLATDNFVPELLARD